MTSADLALFAFTLCNVLRVAAYLPQMMQLYSHPGAAASFSYASWWLFAAANASTAAYGQIVIGDAVLAALSTFSAACCCALIGIARWRTRRPPVVARPSGSALGQAGALQVGEEGRRPRLHLQRRDPLAKALHAAEGRR